MNQNGGHLGPCIEHCMAEDAYSRHKMLEKAFILSSVELKSIGEKLCEYQSFLEAELKEIESDIETDNKKEPEDVKKNQRFEMDIESNISPSISPQHPLSLDPMLELSGARKRKSSLPCRRRMAANRQVNSKGRHNNNALISSALPNEVITLDDSESSPPPIDINNRKDPLHSVKNRLLIKACCKFSLNLQKLPVQTYNITCKQDVGGANHSGRGMGVALVHNEQSGDEARCLSRCSSMSFEVPLQNETECSDDDLVAETPLKSPPTVSKKDTLAGLLASTRNIMGSRKRKQEAGIERHPKRETINTRNNTAKNRLTNDPIEKVDNRTSVVEKRKQKTTSSRHQSPPDTQKLRLDHPSVNLSDDVSPNSSNGSDKIMRRRRRKRVAMKNVTRTKSGMSLGQGKGLEPSIDGNTQALATRDSHGNDSIPVLDTQRRPKPSTNKLRNDIHVDIPNGDSEESMSLNVSFRLKQPKATVMVKRSNRVSKVSKQPSLHGMSWASFQNEIETANTCQKSEKRSPLPPPSPLPQLRSSKRRHISPADSPNVSSIQPLLDTERDNNRSKKPLLVQVESNRIENPPIVPIRKSRRKIAAPEKKPKRTTDPLISETSPIRDSSPESQHTAPVANKGRHNTRSKFLMTGSEPDTNPQSVSNNNIKEDANEVANNVQASDNEIDQQDPSPLKTKPPKSKKNETKTTRRAITKSGNQQLKETTTTLVSPSTHRNTTRSPNTCTRSSNLPTNPLPSPIAKTSPMRSRKPPSSHTSPTTTTISSSKQFNGRSSGSSATTRSARAGSRTDKLPPAFTETPEPVSKSGKTRATSIKLDPSGPPSRLRNTKSIGNPPRYLANRLSILNESRLEKSVMGEKRKLLSSQLGTSALLMNVSDENRTSGGMRKPQLRANLKNFDAPKLKPVKPF